MLFSCSTYDVETFTIQKSGIKKNIEKVKQMGEYFSTRCCWTNGIFEEVTKNWLRLLMKKSDFEKEKKSVEHMHSRVTSASH